MLTGIQRTEEDNQVKEEKTHNNRCLKVENNFSNVNTRMYEDVRSVVSNTEGHVFFSFSTIWQR